MITISQTYFIVVRLQCHILVNGQHHVSNFDARLEGFASELCGQRTGCRVTYRLCIGALTQIGDEDAIAHLDMLAVDDHDAQEALLAHLHRARLGELVEDELRLQMK